MILFDHITFSSKEDPRGLVNKIIARKDFAFCFDDFYLDIIWGRRDRLRFQPDGSIYLKVQRVWARKRIIFRGKMVFRIKPSPVGSEVKVLIRPDLFLLGLFSVMTAAFIFSLIFYQDFSKIGPLFGFWILAWLPVAVSFEKDRRFFKSYVQQQLDRSLFF